MTGTILLRVAHGSVKSPYCLFVQGEFTNHCMDPVNGLKWMVKKYPGLHSSQLDIRPNVDNWPDTDNASRRLRIEAIKNVG